MATALPNTDITKGSDEFLEMFCEQCDEHGINATASGFCLDCQDYMCGTCLLYHSRYMPEHRQQDGNSMPQDFCLEKCDIHHNKVLKFYCETCNGFACATCKRESNKNCNFSHIPSLIQRNTAEAMRDMTELNATFKDMSKALDETKDQINENISLVVYQEKEAKSALIDGIAKRKQDFKRQSDEVIHLLDKRFNEIIRKLRAERQEKVEWLSEQNKKFEKAIDEAVNSVENNLKETAESDKTKLNALEEDCKEISDDLRSLNDSLTVRQGNGRKCALFIAAKKIKTSVSKCQDKIEKVKESNTISYFDIDSENVVLVSQPNRLTYDTFKFKPKHGNVSLIPKPDINLKIDKSSITFTSLCLLSESKIVITNYKHSNMIAYNDLNEQEKVNILPLAASPWDVTKISGQRIAVTLPDTTKIIQLLDPFSDNINLKEIDARGMCHGIANAGDSLIVSFINPVQIKVIDFKGVVKKLLLSQPHFFVSPLCLTVNCHLSRIYISDSVTNGITSMTFDGKVKATYKDDKLTNPLHMTVDDTGSVYVCGRQSNNIVAYLSLSR